jgi:xylan 1,4-beta-xylosidase
MATALYRAVLCFAILCGNTAFAADATTQSYRLVEPFPRLPAGIQLAAASGVAIDSHGDVLVFHRAEPPVLVFHPDGQFVRSLGEKLFKSPHGLRVDSGDDIWVTDNADHIVIKFSHDGKVLMTLGERGVASEDATHFNKPADVVVAANGDFFVADGYGNSRVVKFDKDGKYVTAWGKRGTGPGEFNLPHAVRLDSKGKLYVADRENRRIQVFEQDGTFVREFGGFSPYGLFITPDDALFVTDGRANRIYKMTLEGKVLASWGAGGAKPGDFRLPHGITVAGDGAVYVTEIDGKRVQKFEPARDGPTTRSAVIEVNLAEKLGPLEIGKLASLGQGGQSEEPMWEGRAAEVRALHPRVIRLFLQEYFDVLPAKGQYQFETMDKLVDLTRRSGAEPLMNICFKPKVLYPKIDPAIVEPNDWEEWSRLIEAIVRHYRERGSKIRYWEIMNEPDIGELGGCPYLFTAENYPAFYEKTAAAILRADPEARIGGPAVANPNSPIVEALLKHCAQKKVPLHFVSWHIYSSDPRAVRGTVEGKRAQIAKYPELKGIETFLDEWNVALLRPMRDARFQPCYVCETIYQMKEAGLDYGCYYQIRDYHVEQETFDRFMTPGGSANMAKWWNRNHQNSGMFDYECNVRPAYFAFKLLARLTGERVKLESSEPAVHGLAAHDERDRTYNLIFWNYSTKAIRAEVKVSGAPKGWRAKRIVLDSQTPNPEENARLRAIDPLALEEGRPVAVELEPYGVEFWMIEK